ncbi:MAG: hypothetical protein KAS95_09940 [Candidatus Heimdallarchaeota archaeon]|nr:hypothetical protein [Candidatus Heimdallarchaeota archaeon]
MSVKRPDAFVCNKCGLKFNDEDKKVMKEVVDGIFASKTVCPKCLSADIRTTIIGSSDE